MIKRELESVAHVVANDCDRAAERGHKADFGVLCAWAGSAANVSKASPNDHGLSMCSSLMRRCAVSFLDALAASIYFQSILLAMSALAASPELLHTNGVVDLGAIQRLGREAAIGAAITFSGGRPAGEAHDALGNQLGMLDDVAGMVMTPGHSTLPSGTLTRSNRWYSCS